MIEKVKRRFDLRDTTIVVEDTDHFYDWLEGVASRKDVTDSISSDVRRYAQSYPGKVRRDPH